ncbi:interleukin-12 subunit alpha [Calypte anna]|uniref:interleukin-12 subunit alpha n=1 Tax=Calypte anna TaxID=9244 RepID=UPI0011C3CECD|nr:interleukin-12 subunit alpha [Calypte anna]
MDPHGSWEMLPVLCSLLALLLLLPPPPARALPSPSQHLPLRELDRFRGLNRSLELLEAVNTSAQRLQELGTLGFECILEEVDMEDITRNQLNTIKACTSEDPGAGNCPVLEKSTLDLSKCLQGISQDLSAYRAKLENSGDQKMLAAIDELMTGWVGTGLTLSFREQLKLCSILHAFRIRVLTISRVMSYLS